MDVRVKPIPIQLDKERNLLFDFNALAEAEDKLEGQSIFDVLSKRKIKHIRTLLWAAMLHEDPDLSEQQVGAMFGLQDLNTIADIISQAVSGALPDAKNTKPSPMTEKRK